MNEVKRCPFLIARNPNTKAGDIEFELQKCKLDCAWRLGDTCAIALIATSLTKP